MIENDQQVLVRALDAATNPVLITERSGCIVWINRAFCLMSGYSKLELVGKTPHLLSSDRQSTTFYRNLWMTIMAGLTWQGEMVERRKDGGTFTVNQIITPVLDPHGVVTHFIAILHNFSLIDDERTAMQQLAYHDALTGLPNRLLFLNLLNQAVNGAMEHKQPLALMFIDVDHFKSINDTLGHACGDRLLVAVAERLGQSVRRSDLVARLSGDEFAILICGINQIDQLEPLANKLVAAIHQPFMLDNHRIETAISIGISLYPGDGSSVDDLLARADSAMYLAKRNGGNACRFSLADIPAELNAAKCPPTWPASATPDPE
ncbi:PAS domain S-box-containing protein/diguanylate cyclase (GGDEF) domain-containing protein [Pseudomonas synxantha]|uniref:GAF and PAS/PAC sensor-containing diguanylate cyclase/phosphodiesterase n=1 Tax=Pseudomonas synxantha TaxID=47883 RepID=A0AAX3I7S9_9PSED|nr:diguanylate cyclase [Pseudomonas synxantha]AZE67410.1 diguanylate cyclase/phosphodiesterase [Pseudomonas synxantha]KRP52493.1 histidine kinase [Pseudomonas synxantha]SDU24829.1 PAS domain S-box-containing protein/diguanylate cyclase (GGDEF) domain-containing protein [Pseudomonas synxantha]VTQ98813.1 GAF and PAS/PAC sensor-containing diguanylate cyclase/phosphodiesterase [Pseudomonas synxantha]